jgi:hypothetical protein
MRLLPVRLLALGLLLGVGPAACCRLNRLAEAPASFVGVRVEAASRAQAWLDLRQRAERGQPTPQPEALPRRFVLARYRAAAEELGDARLAESLQTALGEAMTAGLGWSSTDAKGPVLRAELEELRLLAEDETSSIEARWRVRVELDDGHGTTWWRDCLEEAQPLTGFSLEGLGVLDEQGRAHLQQLLARQMAQAVIERLRGDWGARREEDPR